MIESERLGKLRHDLSNPLSALLAEIQLLLLNESQFDPETLTSLREIEALAIRMRAMLRCSPWTKAERDNTWNCCAN